MFAGGRLRLCGQAGGFGLSLLRHASIARGSGGRGWRSGTIAPDGCADGMSPQYVSEVGSQSPSPGRVKLLAVDDDQHNLVALQAILESLDQDLMLAENGTDALRLCLEHDFAAILLDVRMPTMDGFETAEMIRSRRRSHRTPILFLTASGSFQPFRIRPWSASGRPVESPRNRAPNTGGAHRFHSPPASSPGPEIPESHEVRPDYAGRRRLPAVSPGRDWATANQLR